MLWNFPKPLELHELQPVSLHWTTQVVENMKALDVLHKLTPDVMQKIEDIVGTKPKVPDQYR